MLDCGTNLPFGRVSITLIWEYQGVFCYPMFHIVQVRAREIAFVYLKKGKLVVISNQHWNTAAVLTYYE